MPFEFTEHHAELIEKTHQKVANIELVLKGYNSKGLLKQVEENTKSINKLWIALAFIVGMSGIGISIFQILGG